MEKAPVMIDWLAMMVAKVASSNQRREQQRRTKLIKNVSLCRRALKHDGRLAGVVQNETGKNDEIPRPSNGYFPKMAHIGIERFSPSHA